MNHLLYSKTLYRRGVSVELYRTGEAGWKVRCYMTTSGDTISNFRSDRKEVAENYYETQTDRLEPK